MTEVEIIVRSDTEGTARVEIGAHTRMWGDVEREVIAQLLDEASTKIKRTYGI